MNFKGKNITVMGLGLHGGSEGLIRFLVSQGANVKVSDAKPKEDLMPTIDRLADLDVAYRLGGHEWSHFKDADMIFINQAVKPESLWRKRIENSKIPTSTEMNLFIKNCPGTIIGITGTNGKSTAATLTYKIFKKAYEDKAPLKGALPRRERNIFFGGNVGGSLLNSLEKITEKDLIILELSSFQLRDLERIKKSPHISVILNITPDHIDYHKDMADYIDAKKKILEYQDESDFVILNYSQRRTKNLASDAKSRVIYFNAVGKLKSGIYLKDEDIVYKWRGSYKNIISQKEILLPGQHNIENVMAAVACAAIYKINTDTIKEVIKDFRGLEHRIEFAGEIHGVKFYNDSKSTTPESTIAAIKSFARPVILLVGGSEKHVKFRRMSKEIIKKCRAVFVFGRTKNRIAGSIKKRLRLAKEKVLNEDKVFVVDNLGEAFSGAEKISQKGDIIILSPACASFDQFANFGERGDKFKNMVKGLKDDQK